MGYKYVENTNTQLQETIAPGGYVTDGFERVVDRIDGVEERLVNRIDGVEERLRFESQTKHEELNTKIDGVEERLNAKLDLLILGSLSIYLMNDHITNRK
jgi:hypothetical protein